MLYDREDNKAEQRELDLETHLCRKNTQVLRIPEGCEGNNVQELVESIIKTELSLGDLDLKIQRCQDPRIQATRGCIPQVSGGIFHGIKDEGLGSPLCMEEERSTLQQKKDFL